MAWFQGPGRSTRAAGCRSLSKKRHFALFIRQEGTQGFSARAKARLLSPTLSLSLFRVMSEGQNALGWGLSADAQTCEQQRLPEFQPCATRWKSGGNAGVTKHKQIVSQIHTIQGCLHFLFLSFFFVQSHTCLLAALQHLADISDTSTAILTVEPGISCTSGLSKVSMFLSLWREENRTQLVVLLLWC